MKNMSPELEFKILNSLYKSKYVRTNIFGIPKESEHSGSISDFIRVLDFDKSSKKIRNYLKELKEEGIFVFKNINNVNGIDTSFFKINGKKLKEKMLKNQFWIDLQKFIKDEVNLR